VITNNDVRIYRLMKAVNHWWFKLESLTLYWAMSCSLSKSNRYWVLDSYILFQARMHSLNCTTTHC